MRLKRSVKPSSPSFQRRTPCNTRGGSTQKRCSKFLKKRMPCADLRYVKGQHLSWMVYERVILSVKRTNSESKGKRLEVGWEAGSLSLRNFIGFLLPSPYPGQVKSDWQCVKNTRKESMVQWSWKEVNSGKFKPHVPFVVDMVEIARKMTRCSVRPFVT